MATSRIIVSKSPGGGWVISQGPALVLQGPDGLVFPRKTWSGEHHPSNYTEYPVARFSTRQDADLEVVQHMLSGP